MTQFKIIYKDEDGIILTEKVTMDNHTNTPYIIEVRKKAQETAKWYKLKLLSITEI